MPEESDRPASRRGRSARYPGVPLGEAIEFARRIDADGLDGLPAEAIASGLGFTNVRTNTFSARLSAARQFGLLDLRDDGYYLTPPARSILHPVDPEDLPRLHRRALLEPPLYASLAARLEGRSVPEATALANVLYHHEQITASAKNAAAEAFLASARFAGALGDDGIFRPREPDPAPNPSVAAARRSASRPGRSPVRIDLRLWGPDEGKVIRVRAPESITSESFDRLVSALRLHLRVEEPSSEPGGQA